MAGEVRHTLLPTAATWEPFANARKRRVIGEEKVLGLDVAVRNHSRVQMHDGSKHLAHEMAACVLPLRAASNHGFEKVASVAELKNDLHLVEVVEHIEDRYDVRVRDRAQQLHLAPEAGRAASLRNDLHRARDRRACAELTRLDLAVRARAEYTVEHAVDVAESVPRRLCFL